MPKTKESHIIEVKNLTKTYKTHKREKGFINACKSLIVREYEYKKALKNISFSIEEGEIVGLLGPNGAGKSTTIKALSGILFPTSGKVKVLDYTPWADRVKYVANIGVVFGQKQQLLWDLPPVDSFYLNRDLYEIDKEEFEVRLKRMVKLLQVEKIIKTPVRDLSLGERMKCKLIAALLHKPKIVFLDEPSIGLDVIAKDTMRDFIIEANQKYRTTFIVTTHDMQDIERLCKRIIIINHGIVIYDGPLEYIKKKYLTKKTITIKSEEPIKRCKLKGCTVKEHSKYEMTIEVDMKQTKLKSVVDCLMNNGKGFADMIISDPPVEEIIQLIFKSKDKRRIR